MNDFAKNQWMYGFVILVLFMLGGLLSFFQLSSVEAHSSLVEMTPAEKVVTNDPPSSLKLRFNEPVEQDLATVTIYDWNAKPVFTGNPDEGGPVRAPLLEFSLPKLEDGTYTVKWSVVSLDGHPVSGSYTFAVGHPTEGGTKSITGAGDKEGPLIASRAIADGLLLLGAGLFWFGWMAERKRFPSLSCLWKRGRWIGACILLLVSLAELVTYAVSLPPGLIQTVFKGRWDLLLEFPFVLMVLAQLLFLVLLLISGMERVWYLAMWLILAAIPAFGGHVWGMEHPYIALIPRIIHQMSIALWLGALCYMILLVIWQKKHKETDLWNEFRPFFVYKMMVASGLVVVSGVVMVFLQTGWTAVLTDWMGWSTLLSVKILLTILMLSLALYQTLKWKKRQSFTTKRLIRVEWVAGLVIIVMGVWMSQTAYPVAIKSYDSTLTSGNAEAEVNIDKLKTGEQTMTAHVPEVDGEKPEEVNVKISMPDHGMQEGPFPAAEKTDAGDYQVRLPFSMSGTWRLDVQATYPEGEELEWTDELFIAGGGNS